MTARFGHKSVLIYPSSIFIFGGMNERYETTNDMLLFSIPEEKLYNVKRKYSISNLALSIPEARSFYSMAYYGNNLIILYGGVDY